MTGSRAHIILRLHIGALGQQRLNDHHVAVLRGDVERRRSVLPHKRATPSAPPSAVLPTPYRMPTQPHRRHTASVAVKARHCVPRFTRLLPARRSPQPTCPRAPAPPHAVAPLTTTQPSPHPHETQRITAPPYTRAPTTPS